MVMLKYIKKYQESQVYIGYLLILFDFNPAGVVEYEMKHSFCKDSGGIDSRKSVY